MSKGDAEGVIQSQTVVLNMTAQQWGYRHLKTVAAQHELGSYHLHHRQPLSACKQYKAALQTVIEKYPEMTATLDEIRTQLIISEMLARQIMDEFRLPRILNIAHENWRRGRLKRAHSLYSSGLALAMMQLHEPKYVKHRDLYQMGAALMDVNRLADARKLFAKIIYVYAQEYASCTTGESLHQALFDYSECLERSGMARSAQETVQLAFKLIK